MASEVAELQRLKEQQEVKAALKETVSETVPPEPTAAQESR